MATTDTTLLNPRRGPRLGLRSLIGLLALLAPLGYLAGRLSTSQLAGSYIAFLGSGLALGALGAMIGIPIGLFFGSLRSGTTRPSAALSANTPAMERDILEQLRAELVEDKALFDARRGSTTMYARIEYLMSFWTTIKASGRLFVMQDAHLLNTIATAYYWLEQATHLETLAYEAKYAGKQIDEARTAEHLIAEARLLDGQLDAALSRAIAEIDATRS
ncbi:MAG TPA: hypothetical protein VMT30_07190 [Candidatus Saccharimonadia bacterium]|nr:hypothetical protein [Candidatus Saccharimonadia bacterium]